MPKNRPLFSIIIPLYNRKNYIEETLASVKEQTYPNWECIIVDDGSDDNSYQVTQNFIADDSRFKLLRRSLLFFSGGNGARNEGYLNCTGDYILFLDSDDLMSPDKLFAHRQSFAQYPDIDISFSDWVRFRGGEIYSKNHGFVKNKIYSYRDVLDFYGRENSFIQTAAYCIKREFLQKCGIFLEPLKVNQDGEFFVRVLLHKPTLHFAQDGVVKWRMDTTNKSSHEINIIKFRHRIASFKLIEQYRSIFDEPLLDPIIKNAKSFMYRSYIQKAPKLVAENNVFFRDQIRANRQDRNWYYRFIRRLRIIFKSNSRNLIL